MSVSHSIRSNFDPIDVDLTGWTVVITGATGGIGRAAAEGLTQMGARLVFVSRSQAKLDEVAESLGSNVRPIQADLSLMTEVRRVADLLEDEVGSTSRSTMAVSCFPNATSPTRVWRRLWRWTWPGIFSSPIS